MAKLSTKIQGVRVAEVVPGVSAGLVSASGLKGNSGVAPGAGYVGEVLTWTSRNILVSVANAYRHEGVGACVTLSAGTWLLFGKMQVANNTGAGTVGANVSTNSNNDGTGFVMFDTTVFHPTSLTGGSNSWVLPLITSCYVAAAPTTLYPKAFVEDTTGVTVNVYGFAVRIA